MIFRKVVSSEYVGASRYTGYVARSIRLNLECGHTNTRKASDGEPRRARCRDCELLEGGGKIFIDGVEQKPWRP